MAMQIRWVSVLQRKLRAAKERERTLQHFHEGRAAQRGLAAPRRAERKLLVIRLDDIGDYLLFRNQLRMYKHSAQWRDHRVTLLGNASWKALFDTCDAAGVDDTCWIDKREYLRNDAYQLDVWRRLRSSGFDTVVAPSRTRPLVLDDLCMLAAAPLRTIGCANTYVHPDWNSASDALYERLFTPSDHRIHEFHFNAEFAAAICGSAAGGLRPHIEVRFPAPLAGPYLLCFVGANTRSKLWPVRRWIEFITLYSAQYPGRVVIAGGSAAEVEVANAIERRTGALNIAGKVTLPELMAWVGGARAVVTNDTMAAHLGASYDRPTVIVANGVNYRRFTEYAGAGITDVATVYPAVFERRRRRVADLAYHYTDAVSADMASISAARVLESLRAVSRDAPSMPAGRG